MNHFALLAAGWLKKRKLCGDPEEPAAAPAPAAPPADVEQPAPKRRWQPNNPKHILPGFLCLGIGLGIIVLCLCVDEPGGVLAGVVFALAGTLFLVDALTGTGPVGELLRVINSALFLTLFGILSMVFPPAGLIVLTLASCCWLSVARIIIRMRTGKDFMGEWSQEKHLGVGCAMTVGFLLIAALAVFIIGKLT